MKMIAGFLCVCVMDHMLENPLFTVVFAHAPLIPKISCDVFSSVAGFADLTQYFCPPAFFGLESLYHTYI